MLCKTNLSEVDQIISYGTVVTSPSLFKFRDPFVDLMTGFNNQTYEM